MLKSIVKIPVVKRTLALVAALCLWHGAVVAATYNVTTLAQLNTAVSNAQSGDIINVAAGTYAVANAGLTLRAGVQLIGAPNVTFTYNGNQHLFTLSAGTGTTVIKNIAMRATQVEWGVGAAIYVTTAVNASIEGCDIQATTGYRGGAVHVSGGATVSLTNCDVHGCNAQSGGAFDVQNATLNLTGCHIYENTSSGDGSVFFVSGGQVNIKGGNIHDNRSTGYGRGAVGYIDNASTVTVENASFVGNQSQQGGSSFWLTGNGNTLTLSSCTIAGNNTPVTWAPGGIVASGSDQVIITNSIITGNTGGGAGTGDMDGGGNLDIIGSIVDDEYIVNGDTSYTFTEPPEIIPGDSGQVNITLPGTVFPPGGGDPVPITDVPSIPIDVDSSGTTIPTIGSGGGGDNKPPELTLTLTDSLVCVGQQATFTLRIRHLNGDVDYVLYKVSGGVKTQVGTTRSNSGSVSFNLTPQSATVEKYVGEASKSDKKATSKEKLLIVIPLATSGKIDHTKNVDN